MTRACKILILCCLTLPALIFFNACGSGTSATILCADGIRVSQAALRHWEPVIAALNRSSARTLVRGSTPGMTARQRTLRFLTTAARIDGEANIAGVHVSDAAANDMLGRLENEAKYGRVLPPSRMSKLVTAAHASIKRESDRISIVRDQMLSEAISAKQRSEAERGIPTHVIATYYARHMRSFIVPERRDVAVIEIFPRSKSEVAKKEIEAGKSFLEVMKLRNEEPGAGGLKRNLVLRNLDHPYEANYFKAKLHVPVGPLKAEIFYLFDVMAIHAPRQKPLAEVERSIRHALVAHSQPTLLTKLEHGLEKRWRARSSCATPT